MPNTRELRRRIRSVKNTAQITKAMQMVAATKMRRAQNQAMSGRPYNLALNNILANLVQKGAVHPLLTRKNTGKIGVLVLSTDKSLCGALNTNTLRLVQSFSKEHPDSLYYTIGLKGRDFIVKTQQELSGDFENHEKVTFDQAITIAKMLSKAFLDNQLSTVYIIYPDFVSTLRQEPKLVQLLPIVGKPHVKEDLSNGEMAERLQTTDDRLQSKEGQQTSDYLLEPNKESLLNYILAHYVETSIYQSLLETKASEHSARMIAMQNATDNAKELVSDLELAYNQTRQAAITTQILEIASASAALE